LSVADIIVLVTVMLLYVLFNNVILVLFFNNLAVINQIGYKTRTVCSGIYEFTFLCHLYLGSFKV